MKFEIDLVLGLQSHTSGNTLKGLLMKLMKSSVSSILGMLFFPKDRYSHLTQYKCQLGEGLSRN